MSTAWPHPAPEDCGGARHLVAGMKLPDIALASTLGGTVNLARHSGRAVLFIYPWTGRPGVSDPPNWDHIPGAHGSTPEAEGFEARKASFASLGYEIFGLSGQSTAWQQEFASRRGISFALLSDESGAFRDALRLPVFETGGVLYLKRLTLMLEAGAISRVFFPVHPPDTHAAEVLHS